MKKARQEKLETFRKLYVGEDTKKCLFNYEKKQRQRLALLLLIVIVLLTLIHLFAPVKGAFVDDFTLQRPPLAAEDEEVALRVLGVPYDGEIDIRLSPRAYTESEIYDAFDQEFERLKTSALADNEDFNTIENNLDFSLKPVDSKMKATWEVSDMEYLSTQGNIIKENLPESEVHTSITLILSYQDYQRQYPIFIRLINNAEDVSFAEELQAYIEAELLSQREAEMVSLPGEFQGFKLHYKRATDFREIYLLILGLAFVCGSYLSDQEKLKKRLKEREKEMLLDYSEIVSHLVLLIGCGLSIKNAWEKICRDYIQAIKAQKQKKRYAYEEMVLALYRIENGVSEAQAYSAFAISCGLHVYVKLGRLLEQNLRMGNKNLNVLLEAEALDAFQQRKNRARVISEEAGTRLLFPMFLMLLMLLVILMVPALLTFTI